MKVTLCDLIIKAFNNPSLYSKLAILFYRDSWSHWTYLDVKVSSETVSTILKKYINNDVGQFILLILNVTHTTSALMFGVLLSSCAFTCVDSQFPNLSELIEKLKIRFILTNINLKELQLLNNCKHQESFYLMEEEITFWKTDISAETRNKFSFAYAISTSGTTGSPKIVRVTHNSIVPNIVCLTKIFKIVESDVIYFSSPITFDPSIIEIFLALSNGAKLCIIDHKLKLVLKVLAKILCGENGPTFIQTTPTLVRRWNSSIKSKLFDTNSKLRALVLGGEQFPTINEIISWKIHEGINVYNIYGLTEISCWATVNKVWPSDDIDISIGEPLTETIIEIRNKDINSIGEIYLGTLTRFCLVDDEQMADLVKEVPFFRATGDLFQEINQKYYYIGRKDNQLKRWGVKINLGDIEYVVKKLGFINCACVGDYYEDSIIIGLFIFSETIIDCVSFRRNLRKELNINSWPDDIICIKDMPITAHGKMDTKFLKNLLRKKNINRNPKEYFTRYWVHFTGEEVGTAGFISSGGNSFSALQFISALERYSVPDNFLALLLKDGSFSECWLEFESYITNSSLKRLLSDSNNSSQIDKKLKHSLDLVTIDDTDNTEVLYKNLKGRTFPNGYLKPNVVNTQEISFKLCWKYKLGRCIDASPLVVSLKKGEDLAIVGSHSGRIAVLNVSNGQLISECILQDRVESCACLSNCAKYYYLGCYDGRVYKITVRTGKVVWSFPTDDIVKSTCCLSEDNIIFGSYDRTVYKIDKDGIQLWKIKVEGPVLTEVVIHKGMVYVTTLASSLHVIDILTGKELGKYSLSAPVFSSPAIVNDQIVIATVDGKLQWRSLESCEQLYQFESNGQIFSSVTPYKEGGTDYLIFGRGTTLICLKKHHVFWNIELDSNIISTAAFISINRTNYVIVATSKGVIYLIDFDNNGHLFKEYKLPNDIYSSPAILDCKVIVGCRDNKVYCLTLA